MHAIIPAAGAGSRLGELTDDRPKGLVEVAGRPLLSYAFDTVQAVGATSLVVVIGHRGEAIIDRFGDGYGELPITYVHQRDRAGLAHAISLARGHVDGPFIVHNGDNVIHAALEGAVDRVLDGEAAGAILVDEVDREAATTTGVVTVEDGRVTGIVEKPDDPPSTLVTTGFAVLPPATFHACDLVRAGPTGERELSTAIDLLVRAGHRIEPVRIDGWRINVNRPADIDRAAAMLRDGTGDRPDSE